MVPLRTELLPMPDMLDISKLLLMATSILLPTEGNAMVL